MPITTYPPITGGGSGTVTSVSGTGTVSGLSLSGTVTTSGSLTLGGSLTGVVTSVSGSAPVVSSGGAAPAISMAQSSGTVNGYLSSTDWTTFNNKQAALVSGTSIKTVNGATLLGAGDVATVAGSTTQLQYNNAGALAGATNLIYDGTNLGVGMTPDGSSRVQIAAGTATAAPLELTTSAGTLMTTPDDGSIEYDGKAFYGTPIANGRGVFPTEHFVCRTGTKTMTSNTSLQAIFSGGSGGLTNGALSVAAASTYFFECLVTVSSMSATSGNFGFSLVGAGTATFTSAAFISVGYDQTTLTTPAAASSGGTYVATTALTTNVVTATTGTAAAVLFKGIFRTNAAGTIIPSIQLTTAAAAVIGTNSWFKCYPVGASTVISAGNWA